MPARLLIGGRDFLFFAGSLERDCVFRLAKTATAVFRLAKTATAVFGYKQVGGLHQGVCHG